jgi:hypothetical protein
MSLAVLPAHVLLRWKLASEVALVTVEPPFGGAPFATLEVEATSARCFDESARGQIIQCPCGGGP